MPASLILPDAWKQLLPLQQWRPLHGVPTGEHGLQMPGVVSTAPLACSQYVEQQVPDGPEHAPPLGVQLSSHVPDAHVPALLSQRAPSLAGVLPHAPLVQFASLQSSSWQMVPHVPQLFTSVENSTVVVVPQTPFVQTGV